MLEYEPARQHTECFAIDLLWIKRDNRHVEILSNRVEKTLLVYFAGIEHLRRP